MVFSLIPDLRRAKITLTTPCGILCASIPPKGWGKHRRCADNGCAGLQLYEQTHQQKKAYLRKNIWRQHQWLIADVKSTSRNSRGNRRGCFFFAYCGSFQKLKLDPLWSAHYELKRNICLRKFSDDSGKKHTNTPTIIRIQDSQHLFCFELHTASSGSHLWNPSGNIFQMWLILHNPGDEKWGVLKTMII